jgi:hypothetical protein
MFAEAQLKARKFLEGNISQLRAIQQMSVKNSL